jgi:hypothetical protein
VDVIIDAGDHYVTGTFRWFPASVTFAREIVPKNESACRGLRSLAGIRLFRHFWCGHAFRHGTIPRERNEIEVHGERTCDSEWSGALFGRRASEADDDDRQGSSEPGVGRSRKTVRTRIDTS